MKTITVRNFAAVKRTAMNVNPLVTKKNKCLAKMQELNDEILALEEEINGYEGGVIALTGHKSEELVRKVVTKIDKFDKEGKQLTKTEYVPTDIVSFNEETKMYEIHEVELDNPSIENIDETAVVDEKEITFRI